MMVSKPNVFILEYKNNSWISNIIKKITGTPYSHTAMYIEDTFYELNGMGVNYRKEESTIDRYIAADKIDVFAIDYIFNKKQIKKMKSWWDKNIELKKEYGYETLLLMLVRVPMRQLMRWYFVKRRKPFPIKLFRNEDVCSAAVDKCLKEGGCDIFPEFQEAGTSYPGLYASKLKNNKIISTYEL